MRLIAQVKLQTNPQEFSILKKTLESANAACNHISAVAWEQRTFHQVPLHHLTYREIRERFGLTAQVAVRCISKVADAYKKDRKSKRTFKSHSAIAFDDRILSWNLDKSEVSIWTVNGRKRIGFVCGQHQREQLKFRRGESDLVLFRDNFYLSATCEIDEPIPTNGNDVIGIDLGIANIAVTSDGEIFAGNVVNSVRYRYRRLRTKLQKKGTRSAKRLLRKLSGRERRFAKNVNHTITKRIVTLAKDTHRSIALEDLSGIRERATVRREQRVALHSWSFFQFRSFLEYKCILAGIPLMLVSPAYTSQTCSECGYCDKSNRKSQSKFVCGSCGYVVHADLNAAKNIRGVAVSQPYVSTTVPS